MCKDCERLHEELYEQSEEMYWLRKQIKNLEANIRSERLDKRKLVKEKKGKKPQYRDRRDKLHPSEYEVVF